MKVNYEILLEALLKERDRILKKNPELITYQLEIDRELAALDDQDPKARIQKLTEMLMYKLSDELIPANEKLLELKKRLETLEAA